LKSAYALRFFEIICDSHRNADVGDPSFGSSEENMAGDPA
jgi:hypothetical protein